MSRPDYVKVTAAIREVRRHLRLVQEYAAVGDRAKAYAEAETAQMAAFDLKILLAPELPQQGAAGDKERQSPPCQNPPPIPPQSTSMEP